MIIRLGIWDPALERFSTVDPHTEKYYSWSPYHYAANNPIKKTKIVRNSGAQSLRGTANNINTTDGQIDYMNA